MTRTATAIALTALLASAAAAHHSPAVFDRSRQVTLEGVVTEFRWGNPHSWIHLDVTNGDAVESWVVEMDPATHLSRSGWTSKTVAPGDRVAVKVHPLRNDEKGGQYISITLPDGKVMNDRSPDVLPPPKP
ncbi:MAG TPA: DUF6152 family protein [Gammaproteobacteria bacterium]